MLPCRLLRVSIVSLLVCLSSAAVVYPTTNASTTARPSVVDVPPLDADSYITIAVVVAVLLALALNVTPCSIMFCAGLALRLTNVISTKELLDGLSETGVVTIGLLFIVVSPIPNLPIVRQIIALILDGKYQLLKMCLICYALSWCTGNVPLVVLLLPIVKSYCRDHKLAPSQMLMSMNVAALLGGSFSVIGTSTNLVYSTLMRKQGLPAISFFEMAKVSLLPAVLALAYLAFAPRFALPARGGGLLRKVREDAPAFVAQFRVLAQSPLLGQSVNAIQAHLPKSTGDAVMIIGVRSGGELSTAVMATPRRNMPLASGSSPMTSQAALAQPQVASTIHLGDRVVLAGAVADLHIAASLLHMAWEPKSSSNSSSSSPSRTEAARMGLGKDVVLPLDAAEHVPTAHTDYFEVVLGHNCPCVGRMVGQGTLLSRYNASLLSLRRRDGQDLVNEEDIAVHELAVGDTLLLLAPETLPEQFGSDFFVVSQLQVPQRVHPFIIEVPDMCCIGRYVSVDVAGGGGSGDSHKPSGPSSSSPSLPRRRGGIDATPVRQSSDRAIALPFDANDDEANSQQMKSLDAPLALYDVTSDAANGNLDDEDDGEPVRTTRKVLVLPDAYRNVALLVFIAMVAASVSGIPIELSTATAAAVLVLLRLVPLRDALKCVDVELLIMIAFSFTLGAAITSTHVADNLAKLIAGHGLRGLPLLLCVSFVTMFFANAITSKACAQVMVPLTVSLCRLEGIDPFPACILLTCATASSIATPYGHPSNLLIFGPGGYKPIDFVKFGLPLNLVLCVAMSVMTAAVYDQW